MLVKYIQDKTANILFTIAFSSLIFYLWINSGKLDGAGMAAIFLAWLPFILGILTIILYLIVHIFTKRYSWIITVVGATLNLMLLI